jgi:uncharacterized membrane protein YebE (DUF533 family)
LVLWETTVADDEVQITTPLGYTFLAPIRSERTVSRIRGLAGVSQVARALHDHYKIEPVEEVPPWPERAPPVESHELLTPQTAATLSQLHAVEAELMVLAMIEAAKSDGRIDPEERRRILTCLKDADTSDAVRQALLAAMDKPADVDALVARVDSPELAVEVYAASLLAIKDDKPSERRYLATLARRLNLAPDTVKDMHARFGDPAPLAPPG